MKTQNEKIFQLKTIMLTLSEVKGNFINLPEECSSSRCKESGESGEKFTSIRYFANREQYRK